MKRYALVEVFDREIGVYYFNTFEEACDCMRRRFKEMEPDALHPEDMEFWDGSSAWINTSYGCADWQISEIR